MPLPASLARAARRTSNRLSYSRSLCRSLGLLRLCVDWSGPSERCAELEDVPIGIGEVERLGWDPLVHDRAYGRDAAAAQALGGALDLGFVDGESKVLQRPIGAVLLQDDHAPLSAGAQKEPLPLLVAQADFETEHVAVERLRCGEVAHSDRHLVDSLDLDHRDLLRTASPRAPMRVAHPVTSPDGRTLCSVRHQVSRFASILATS